MSFPHLLLVIDIFKEVVKEKKKRKETTLTLLSLKTRVGMSYLAVIQHQKYKQMLASPGDSGHCSGTTTPPPTAPKQSSPQVQTLHNWIFQESWSSPGLTLISFGTYSRQGSLRQANRTSSSLGKHESARSLFSQHHQLGALQASACPWLDGPPLLLYQSPESGAINQQPFVFIIIWLN